MMPQQDCTAQAILERLSDLENYPDEGIRPYLEFNVDGKLYYFTPGGFLYRRELGTEEIGGYFCGYLLTKFGTTEPTTTTILTVNPPGKNPLAVRGGVGCSGEVRFSIPNCSERRAEFFWGSGPLVC